MKVFVALSCVLFATVVLSETIEEKKERMKLIFQECGKEHNPSEDDLAILKEKKVVPSSDAGKCTLSCVMKKVGFQGADGKFDKAATIAKVEMAPEEKKQQILDAIEKCDSEVEEVEDHCDNAALLMSCAYKYEIKIPF